MCSQPFFEWRGSPIRVSYNLVALNESSFQVLFLCLPHGQEKHTEGIRVIRCFKIPFVDRLPIGPSLPKLIYDVIHLFYGAAVLLKEKDIKVIHGVEDSGIPALLLAKIFRKKLVFEKHSDPASHKTGNVFKNLVLKLYKSIENIIIKNADLVIGTGDKLVLQATQVKEELNAISIPDIPSSVHESCDNAGRLIRDQLGIPKNNILATYVGSFAVYQGIDLLFETINLAVKENPNLQFCIIGGSDSQINHQKQILEKNGIANTVIFTGMIDPDKLPAYLKASDILISPRISGQNSPLKILDYLKAARPIVATDIEANNQILSQDNAMLVQAKALPMAKALNTLAKCPRLRKKLATAGSLLLGKRYNYTYFRAQIVKGYESLNCQ